MLQEMDPAPTKGEIHLLAYLSYLLSVYAAGGSGAKDWGYAFAATPGGSPFSEDLEVEMVDLISGGALALSGTTLRLTQEGSRLQKSLLELDLLQDRIDGIDSAIATIYVMPVGMVRAAFAHDPDLLLVAEHDRSRILATENALARLYDEFDAVSDILGTAHRSLFAASVLWLTYLAERNTTTTSA